MYQSAPYVIGSVSVSNAGLACACPKAFLRRVARHSLVGLSPTSKSNIRHRHGCEIMILLLVISICCPGNMRPKIAGRTNYNETCPNRTVPKRRYFVNEIRRSCS